MSGLKVKGRKAAGSTVSFEQFLSSLAPAPSESARAVHHVGAMPAAPPAAPLKVARGGSGSTGAARSGSTGAARSGAKAGAARSGSTGATRSGAKAGATRSGSTARSGVGAGAARSGAKVGGGSSSTMGAARASEGAARSIAGAGVHVSREMTMRPDASEINITSGRPRRANAGKRKKTYFEEYGDDIKKVLMEDDDPARKTLASIRSTLKKTEEYFSGEAMSSRELKSVAALLVRCLRDRIREERVEINRIRASIRRAEARGKRLPAPADEETLRALEGHVAACSAEGADAAALGAARHYLHDLAEWYVEDIRRQDAVATGADSDALSDESEPEDPPAAAESEDENYETEPEEDSDGDVMDTLVESEEEEEPIEEDEESEEEYGLEEEEEESEEEFDDDMDA